MIEALRFVDDWLETIQIPPDRRHSVSKLVEATHVTLGGGIGPSNAWAHPYLDDQHSRYSSRLLTAADALLLGRVTYEGLSAAYTKMAGQAPPGVPSDFIDRMKRIPKFVASRTLQPTDWNVTHIEGDVSTFVENLKRGGKNLLKYGNGPLDATLMEHRLIDGSTSSSPLWPPEGDSISLRASRLRQI